MQMPGANPRQARNLTEGQSERAVQNPAVDLRAPPSSSDAPRPPNPHRDEESVDDEGASRWQRRRASIYCGCGRLVALARGGLQCGGGARGRGTATQCDAIVAVRAPSRRTRASADKRGGQRRVLAGLPASSHFSCLAVAARTGRRANCARGIPLTRTRLP